MLFQDVMYLTNIQRSMLLEEYGTHIYTKSADHRINKKARLLCLQESCILLLSAANEWLF